jgi:hypothetical protein
MPTRDSLWLARQRRSTTIRPSFMTSFGPSQFQ